MNVQSNTGNSVVVFSGGSAANSLTDVFNHLVETRHCNLSYVIPISDNGGSTSELIRVFGGPGIGDVRSRLVRLIPSSSTNLSRRAIRDFFNYRLAPDPTTARAEWLDIVEARHTLWDDISSAKKELIRSFLNHVNLEIVKRARPTSVFNFGGASVGNLFLTGARLFSGSFESAIYLLSSICEIPSTISVLPAINTNFSHHICAGLADGTTIPGQNAISHPSEATSNPSTSSSSHHRRVVSPPLGHASDVEGETHEPHRDSLDHADTIEDANWPGSLPVLRKPYISFSKTPPPPAPEPPDAFASTLSATASHDSDTVINTPSPPSTVGTAPNSTDTDVLPTPIRRLWYINPYGQEIRPYPNPAVLSAVRSASSIIYSIGSLYTSLLPSLILRGVAAALPPSAPKILILNGSTDRETSSASHGPFSALDFIAAVVRALRESAGVSFPSATNANDSDDSDDSNEWQRDVHRYITHLVYIDEGGAPEVDVGAVRALGIETVRVWGRWEEGRWGYDGRGLARALVGVVGGGGRGGRSTLVG